jgi:hypothetical protein
MRTRKEAKRQALGASVKKSREPNLVTGVSAGEVFAECAGKARVAGFGCLRQGEIAVWRANDGFRRKDCPGEDQKSAAWSTLDSSLGSTMKGPAYPRWVAKDAWDRDVRPHRLKAF